MIGIKCERGVAPLLQAIRREVRGLRRQADLPRVRRRGTRAPRAPDSRIPRARRAPAATAARQAARSASRGGSPRCVLIDLHLHTTASDGTLPPARSSRAPRSAGLHDHQHHRSRHVRRPRRSTRRRDRARPPADRRRRDHRRRAAAATCTAGVLRRSGRDRGMAAFLAASAPIGSVASARSATGSRARLSRSTSSRCSPAAAESPGRSVGRPLIADALVAAGMAQDRNDAFDRLLGNDGPAFVPRPGRRPTRSSRRCARRAGSCRWRTRA